MREKETKTFFYFVLCIYLFQMRPVVHKAHVREGYRAVVTSEVSKDKFIVNCPVLVLETLVN